MRNLMVIALVLAGGLLVYNYTQTGELTLIPGSSMSDEERELRDLERELAAARKELATAGRGAGLAGIDTSAGVGAARGMADGVARSLEKLAPRLEDDALRARAARLLRETRAFISELE